MSRLAFFITALALGLSPAAKALPSFSDQTGVGCVQCHSIGFGPALTAYGREFKLNGYSWGTGKAVPFDAMLIAGWGRTSSDLPEAPADHFSTNSNVSINEVSGFFAGRLGSHGGGFVQVTYSGIDRAAAWDNLDVRFVHPVSIGGHATVLGVSFNNSPTTQDVWNSTPAWSFPYTGSELVPTPAAAPILSDALAQTVLGATVYALIDDRFYLEVGGYRGLSDRWLDRLGASPDDSPHLTGVAPYWRATYQRQLASAYFSVGVFGLSARERPDPTIGERDRFDDTGLDATFQYTGSADSRIDVNASFIHEHMHLAASTALESSDRVGNHTDTLHLDVGYAWKQTYVASVGLFDIAGNANAGLYPAEPVDGSATGKPDSRGYILQLEYVPWGKNDSLGHPWLNLRIGLQYTGYDRFNGGRSNYDGFGRRASDNDTLFAFVWCAI